MYVRILSGPRPTNSYWKAIISSLMAASVLLCLRVIRCLHLPVLGVQQRQKPVLHRTSSPIEGTQSPALSAGRPRECLPRGSRRDIAQVELTAPRRPIRFQLDLKPNHLACGVPSFFCAYEVSCRVRAERVKPYAPKERFTPGPSVKVRVGSPVPRRHPGARRYGYAVVNSMYTPVTSCCQYFLCQQIQVPELLRRLPFGKCRKSPEELKRVAPFRRRRPLRRCTKNDPGC